MNSRNIIVRLNRKRVRRIVVNTSCWRLKQMIHILDLALITTCPRTGHGLIPQLILFEGTTIDEPMETDDKEHPRHYDPHVWRGQGNLKGIFEAFKPKVKV